MNCWSLCWIKVIHLITSVGKMFSRQNSFFPSLPNCRPTYRRSPDLFLQMRSFSFADCLMQIWSKNYLPWSAILVLLKLIPCMSCSRQDCSPGLRMAPNAALSCKTRLLQTVGVMRCVVSGRREFLQLESATQMACSQSPRSSILHGASLQMARHR